VYPFPADNLLFTADWIFTDNTAGKTREDNHRYTGKEGREKKTEMRDCRAEYR